MTSVEGRNVERSRQIFKVKCWNHQQNVVNPKASLVARGSQQKHGLYFVKHIHQRWSAPPYSLCQQFRPFWYRDASDGCGYAFLSGKINDDVYMEVSDGVTGIDRKCTV